jgi:hypothetical protein
MIHFVVPKAHDRGIHEYLAHWGADLAPRIRVVHSESLPTASRMDRGTYVLAAMDQYSPGMASYIAALHAAMVNEPDVRFLNTPGRTLQRFELLRQMHAAGRNVFRAVRVNEDLTTLRYPVFVRDSQTHDGALSPFLHSPSEVEAAVGRALVQGRLAQNLMVVEFCDTSDAAGYFRKYSAFVVGPHILPRYLSWSREWMLKFRGSEFTPRMAEEELEYLMTNPHEAELRSVFRLAGVEYGRIDYAMKDGAMQVWEINLNPTIGRGTRESSGRVPADVAEIRDRGKHHFYRAFADAWRDVDVGGENVPAIAPAIDESVIRSALIVEDGEPPWLSALKRVLRPAKPIIAPIVDRALPVIGRAAMRRPRG